MYANVVVEVRWGWSAARRGGPLQVQLRYAEETERLIRTGNGRIDNDYNQDTWTGREAMS